MGPGSLIQPSNHSTATARAIAPLASAAGMDPYCSAFLGRPSSGVAARLAPMGLRLFAERPSPESACAQQHWMPAARPPRTAHWNLCRVIAHNSRFRGTQLAFGAEGFGAHPVRGATHLQSERIAGRVANLLPLSFAPLPIPATFGCTLQIADGHWAKHSRQSRLLHLKSHDSSLAEVFRLVLSDGEVAGGLLMATLVAPSLFFEVTSPRIRKKSPRNRDFSREQPTPLSAP